MSDDSLTYAANSTRKTTQPPGFPARAGGAVLGSLAATTKATQPQGVGAAAGGAVLGSLAATSLSRDLPALSARLDDLRALLGADLADVERGLEALCTASASAHLGRRAASHLVAQRGKRIRPVCVLLGARIAGAVIDHRAVDLAIACELVHAATLLHDDVIDEGTERRGAPAARVVYGNSASILGGDLLLVQALDRVRAAGKPELLATLLETLTSMVAAEATQLARRGTLEPSRERYLDVADGKTAALFRWALTAGAGLGELGGDALLALGEIGTALGRAFQLVDDVLDLEGDARELGKDLYADLEQGKLTWPLLVAMERDARLLARLEQLARASSPDPSDLARVLECVRATGALDETRSRAMAEVERARASLRRLPASAATSALGQVIDAVVLRRS